jgi:hypothetical protein
MTETPAEDVTTPEPEPTGIESTGNERIDEALTRLDALDELDINDHPEQFDAIHQALRESLASAGRDGDAPESP